MLASWFPGTSVTSHFSFILLKNKGISSHSFFEIDFMLDFTSPKSISESAFVLSIIASISEIVSFTVVFFQTKISFAARLLSKPICRSVTTRKRLLPSTISAGYDGTIFV